MRDKFWTGISALAAIAAGVCAASAADMAVPVYKAPVYKAPPVIVSDWAGFYVGINGGGAWVDTTFDTIKSENTKASGGVFGGHVGYNWQFGSFVVGVEGDFDGADVSKTDVLGVTQKLDELGTVRARAGYTFAPSLLAYGTAGYAYAHAKFSDAATSVSVDENGWVAGAGVEYKVWGPLIARAEYLHYDFNKFTLPGDNGKTTVDVVRAGLSYKF
jgi:outer membrane immunogenic protein